MAKANADEKCINRYVPDYTLFDLETTGFSRERDEIVEISAVKVRGGKIVDEYSTLVNPGIPMPLDAMLVNHITDKMLKDQPVIKSVLPGFFRFTGDDILVGHNIATFDMPFIRRDCERFFKKTPPHTYVDTLRLAKLVFPEMQKLGLGTLAEHFGIETDGAHRALFDCRMNQQVFEIMGEVIASGKIPLCPLCKSPLKQRKYAGKIFYGCSSFPSCRHTQNSI